MTGFILAAGFGTRMGPLTANIPKPLLEAAGAPLLAHTIFLLVQMGIRTFVVNVHYRAEQIIAYLAGLKMPIEIRTSRETEILGTAGGIRFATALIESDLVVIANPDCLLWPRRRLSLEDLTAWLGDADALLFVAPRTDSGVTGLSLESSGRLRFDDEGPVYYAGLSVMRVSALNHISRGTRHELGPVWRGLAEAGKLRGMMFDGEIVDMGTQEAFAKHNGLKVPEFLEPQWKRFLMEQL